MKAQAQSLGLESVDRHIFGHGRRITTGIAECRKPREKIGGVDEMTIQSHTYTRQFFERIGPGCRRSAERVVPKVMELIRPRSVVDVGCGTGAWLAEIQRAGADIQGADGSWIPKDLLLIPSECFLAWDFCEPLRLARSFDLAVCLEFAEHLPASAAENLVASLTALAPIILFSAATPGQGGDGHLNEQPRAWWEEQFARHDYRCCSGFAAQFASDPHVEWWYSRNMVFFIRDGIRFPDESPVLSSIVPSSLLSTKPTAITLGEIQPVIMTCAASMPYVRDFVASYQQHIGDHLAAPIIVIDLTASNHLPGDYLTVLSELSPRNVSIHPRVPDVPPKDSINDAAFFVLECGLAAMAERQYLLFLEDDVAFSSHLLDYLKNLEIDADLGLLTLYSPGGGYGSEFIAADRYYGTQCVLFPKRVLQPILDHRSEMEHRFSPNYDLRWAQWLGSRGYKIRASPQSYAQHMGQRSRLGCNFHSSHTFVP